MRPSLLLITRTSVPPVQPALRGFASYSASSIQASAPGSAPLLVVGGYTATIRPRASYTNALKRQQIVAYGYPDTDPRGYEEDHLIALELGGAPSDQCNLWPEPAHSPNPKDKVENVLCQRVCAGSLTLVEAQQRIATDWTTAAR